MPSLVEGKKKCPVSQELLWCLSFFAECLLENGSTPDGDRILFKRSRD
jgi:hypothetical protein